MWDGGTERSGAERLLQILIATFQPRLVAPWSVLTQPSAEQRGVGDVRPYLFCFDYASLSHSSPICWKSSSLILSSSNRSFAE